LNLESLVTLRALTARALEALFEPLCGALTVSESDGAELRLSTDRRLAASIVFTSPRLSGELALLAPTSFVEAVLPSEVRGRELPYRMAADWFGELSNQLVGRLKNQLLAYGVDIMLGTPRSVPCGEIRRTERPASLGSEFFLESQRGLLVAYLFVEDAAGVELTTPMPGAAVSEGDIVLF
jgi:hypothetical protein